MLTSIIRSYLSDIGVSGGEERKRGFMVKRKGGEGHTREKGECTLEEKRETTSPLCHHHEETSTRSFVYQYLFIGVSVVPVR